MRPSSRVCLEGLYRDGRKRIRVMEKKNITVGLEFGLAMAWGPK